MLVRISLVTVATLMAAVQAHGQTAASGSQTNSTQSWRRAGQSATTAAPPSTLTATAGGANSPAGSRTPAPLDTKLARRPVTRVTSGTDTLPNGHGQVWREYDISPYTVRVTSTQRPEQAVVDWILRETGYEAWHGEPLGILSATGRTLRVYHTPEMQAVVADMVDRFVSSEAETRTFSLRVATVNSPSWRAMAQRLMLPVTVQTSGIGAWVMEKENAAILLAELRRRNDYREHSSPHMLVSNGQSSVVSAMRGRGYIRDVALRPDVWPGYEVQTGQVDEGFSLDFSPLLSADMRMIDATIRCHIDQVEKMIPVSLEVPTAAAPRQRTKIEVPQITHFRFHERFRWPVDQVLLVGMGMVALPVPVDAKAKTLVAGIPLPVPKTPPRADLLVFVEAKDRAGGAPRVTTTPRNEATSYRGRY